MNKEAEFKRLWLEKHNKADEIVVDAKSKEIVAAVYHYSPTMHKVEVNRLWRTLAAMIEAEELEEYSESKEV